MDTEYSLCFHNSLLIQEGIVTTKFNKYIIKLFIKYIFVVQVFVGIITLVANTFQHTKMLSEYGISFYTLLIYDLMKVPYLLYTTMPMTIVVSTMLVMVTLLKNNELLAYVSLGGKIRSLVTPFLLSGLVLAGVLYFAADYINPKVMLEREKFSFENIKKKTFNISGKLTDLWLKETDSSFINISLMDPAQRQLLNVTEYHLNDDFQVGEIVTYDSATAEGDEWVISNYRLYEMYPVPTRSKSIDSFSEKRELFDELTSLPVLKPQYLSLKEIKRISAIMKKQDLNAAKYELQLYKSYAHAASVVVIILVIFPLCIGFSRNHSYISVASKSLFTGFAYWLIMASFQSLGKTGLFGPAAANFIPVAAFMLLSAVLIYRRERAQ